MWIAFCIARRQSASLPSSKCARASSNCTSNEREWSRFCTFWYSGTATDFSPCNACSCARLSMTHTLSQPASRTWVKISRASWNRPFITQTTPIPFAAKRLFGSWTSTLRYISAALSRFRSFFSGTFSFALSLSCCVASWVIAYTSRFLSLSCESPDITRSKQVCAWWYSLSRINKLPRAVHRSALVPSMSIPRRSHEVASEMEPRTAAHDERRRKQST
mmetsp:Transcript_29382/g.73413  ORF Transcript_29382/g.73413 Transcript_29382/m.73413 type:complete len:219 (-) Transcript_29382:1633-2289(-)